MNKNKMGFKRVSEFFEDWDNVNHALKMFVRGNGYKYRDTRLAVKHGLLEMRHATKPGVKYEFRKKK